MDRETIWSNVVGTGIDPKPLKNKVTSVNGKTGEVNLTAKDVGALNQNELQNGVNLALQQAKESGAFDGKDGNDYILTEKDKQEIADMIPSSSFSVKEIGAIGDGVTDDTEAIQTALDACHANGGGTVIIPTGTYLLSDALKFYSNQHIKGEPGAVLVQKDGNTGGAWGNLMRNYYNGSGGYDATENVIIEGLTFDGGAQEETATTLLAFCHSKNICIKNCTFKNGFSNGTTVGTGHDIEVNSSHNVTVSDCLFRNNRRTGYSSEIIQIDCAYSEGAYPWTPDDGVRNDDRTPSDTVTVSGCIFEGVTRDTLANGNSFVGSHTSYASLNVVVEHCTMRNGCYAVIFNAVQGLTVRDNSIYDTAAGVMVKNDNADAVALNNILSGTVQTPYNGKVIGQGNILNGVPVEDVGGIEVSGAKVGDFLKVKEVDENGVPTAWETVDIVTQYPIVNMTEPTAEILPNHFYRWGEVASLSLTIAPEIEGVASEFLFGFVSGETATELTLPESVKWAVEPNIEAGKTYQVSILNGLAVIIGA